MLQFWKENVEKFEEKDFQILRVLLKLLEASRETRTLAVGCHDLGKFITNHPHGRSIVTGDVKSSCSVSHIQAFLTYPELDGHPMPHMPAIALLSGAAAAAYLQLKVQKGLAAVLRSTDLPMLMQSSGARSL